jgi:FlaA1/EpsC-like NDP-sugar epimerase
MSDKGVTAHLPHSDWHIIKSIGVENRGGDILVGDVGEPAELIRGVREMVLTIEGDFPAYKIDIVEVNGVRFKREPQ